MSRYIQQDVIILFFVIHRIKCQLNVITDDTPLAERGPCISNPCLHNGLCTITNSGFICTCVDGYIGVMCERRSDDCPYDDFLECGNGRCKLDMIGHPKCLCNDGYKGPSCSTVTDSCNDNPCLNGGTCKEKKTHYECICPKGNHGSHCQISKKSVDKCLVCDKNDIGGKCWHDTITNITVSWGYGDFICNSKETCFDMPQNNTNADYMEVQLKPVTMQYNDRLVFITHSENTLSSNQFLPHILPMETSSEAAFLSCNVSKGHPITDETDISLLKVNQSFLNVGTQYFLADINTLYRCVFGLRVNVTVKTHDCAQNNDNQILCNGRGRCFSDYNKQSYECVCCDGYIGKYCQHEDPCPIKPCANNGTCIVIDYGEGMLKHSCTCATGYYGDTCQYKINSCSNNKCQNNASCHLAAEGYVCECEPEFCGTYCEIKKDKCSNVLCKNGATCFDGLNSFFCKCPSGYKGTLCEIEINECENSPCAEGTCIDLLHNYTCACRAGHVGRNCEILLNECSTQDCVNGKCVEDIGGDACNCGIGYTGLLCEVKLDLCEFSKFCEKSNAKSCHDHGSNVTCVCLDGWTGNNCRVNIDDCAHVKCMNNGSCVDNLNGYECKCRDGYYGKACEDIEFKSSADIEIEFYTDDCQKHRTVKGIQLLETNVIKLLRSSCNCPFSKHSINSKTSRVACKSKSNGLFMMDLTQEDEKYLHSLVCNLLFKATEENDILIFQNLYLESINDDKNLCTSTVMAKSEEYSKSGVLVGVVIGILIIVLSLILVSVKIRNIRRKIGVTQTPNKEAFSFDNKVSKKEHILKEENTDETSFTSSDSHDLPKWSEGFTRSNQLYERNKRTSQYSNRSFRQ